MARELRFKIKGAEYSVSPLKVDRRKLYGWSELMAMDNNGDPMELLSADESGKFIIPLGGTGIGILSDTGKWVERSELKTVDAEGNPAPLFGSSFSVLNELHDTVTPERFLDHSITDFYQLTDVPEGMIEAVGSDIYGFEYTYNDSYDPSPAFVMESGGALFLLTGALNIYEMLCFGDCGTIDDDQDDRLLEEGMEDIDFSMF